MQTKLTAFIKKRPAEDAAEGSDKKPREAAEADDATSLTVKKRVDQLGDAFELEKTTIGVSWFNALRDEFDKPYFANVKKFVAAERKTKTIFPPDKDIYSWSRYCALQDVKVVIIGQDPYINPNQAHGLCFSVLPGNKVPPSLVNIYKELETDVPGFKAPKHGYLESWSKQGVLLLNAVLTVEQGKANSHQKKGWEEFTTAVIATVNSKLQGVVFILWGKNAQSLSKQIDKKKHHILAGTHPSPLSASGGFFGCKHFSKCNQFLKEEGKTPINWSSVCGDDALALYEKASE